MDLPNQLARAAEDGDAQTVTRLLAEGAEADAPNVRRCTPLELAVSAGRPETVRLLLAAGADPGGPAGEYGELTPMLLAAMGPDLEVVRALLDAGAPVGPQGKMELVPLPVAATSGDEGHPHIVALFLDRGQDIDVVMKGHTALELAVDQGRPRMARWLLGRGAKTTEHALSVAYHRARRSPEEEALYKPLFLALYAARPGEKGKEGGDGP
ncbi:ankyrin repeat domain-containing protein [Streptomyces sp. NBC_01244]|uniref:ankyrin repeat domain-containing protein n=1 Tax=Streptomyces sp. NBC_01244 TaxID=2903797 RepID=UPI002E0D4EFB|nr:ankyrin repeat domain-containing protein [Streptomyces sp. NBC_01244]